MSIVNKYYQGQFDGVLCARNSEEGATNRVLSSFNSADYIKGGILNLSAPLSKDPNSRKDIILDHQNLKYQFLNGISHIDLSKVKEVWLTHDPNDLIYYDKNQKGTYFGAKGIITFLVQEDEADIEEPVPSRTDPVTPVPGTDPGPNSNPDPGSKPVPDPGSGFGSGTGSRSGSGTGSGKGPVGSTAGGASSGIAGPQGPAGPPGKDGLNGPQGSTGAQGPPGSDALSFNGAPKWFHGCMSLLLMLFLILGCIFFLTYIYGSCHKPQARVTANCEDCERELDSLKKQHENKPVDTTSGGGGTAPIPPSPPDTTSPPPPPPPPDTTNTVRKDDETDTRRKESNADQGMITVSLIWDPNEDLDMALQQPNGKIINYYEGKFDPVTEGQHDVDWKPGSSNKPLENINIKKPESGTYKVYVRRYTKKVNSPAIDYKLSVDMNNKRYNVSGKVRDVNRQDKYKSWQMAYQFNYPPR
jgi:hypothetical protein